MDLLPLHLLGLQFVLGHTVPDLDVGDHLPGHLEGLVIDRGPPPARAGDSCTLLSLRRTVHSVQHDASWGSTRGVTVAPFMWNVDFFALLFLIRILEHGGGKQHVLRLFEVDGEGLWLLHCVRYD